MISEAITLISGSLVVYHHALYPAAMAFLGKRCRPAVSAVKDEDLPTVTVVMAAYNEAEHIASKIANLAALDYPVDKLQVVIGADGCDDETAGFARQAANEHPDLSVTIHEYAFNRGKVPVLNQLMRTVGSDICVLSDVSAEIDRSAVRKLATHFVNPNVGAVGAGYSLANDLNPQGSSYWTIQSAVKVGESRLGGLVGAHGALYAIRTKCWSPLPTDTINDDFIIPMRIATDGWQTLYDPSCRARERDAKGEADEMRRRIRIGAGNLQQLLWLIGRLRANNPGLAFAFLSGKVLRVIAPVLMLTCLIGSLVLAPNSALFTCLAALQLLGYIVATLGFFLKEKAPPKALSLLTYFVMGHIVSFAGALSFMAGRWQGGWSRKSQTSRQVSDPRALAQLQYLPLSVRVAKRSFDICGCLMGLFFLAPAIPLIALAIKLDSPGPVFFRQRRVGRAIYDRTQIFMMIKFRSMRNDAEKNCGAVWAKRDDPRVTKVGRVLRKTRLDEIPQLINVLKGDMSIVGPRPERPELCAKLERNIPYYAERTYGLRPGITGLAQVNQGYDETIEDVRRKVMFDHAYAACSSKLASWLRMDLSITARTISVMGFGRGQ